MVAEVVDHRGADRVEVRQGDLVGRDGEEGDDQGVGRLDVGVEDGGEGPPEADEAVEPVVVELAQGVGGGIGEGVAQLQCPEVAVVRQRVGVVGGGQDDQAHEPLAVRGQPGGDVAAVGCGVEPVGQQVEQLLVGHVAVEPGLHRPEPDAERGEGGDELDPRVDEPAGEDALQLGVPDVEPPAEDLGVGDGRVEVVEGGGRGLAVVLRQGMGARVGEDVELGAAEAEPLAAHGRRRPEDGEGVGEGRAP